DIMVYPNWIVNGGDMTYDTYASGTGQNGAIAGKTYTLEEYFVDGSLSMHDNVEDICGGNVTVDVTITAPDGKTTTKIKNIEEFKKFKFEGDPAGKDPRSYTITYKFTDARFNSKTCEHVVTVVRNAPPIPTCPSTPLTIYTDDDCKAIYNVTLDEIPTASVRYYYEKRYG
ncbi:MAG: hypothetical protein J6X12_12050, partial [Paludibacteraceae bacterium]|nr:hypothetical protein [Paludibacteraceae bacterium]